MSITINNFYRYLLFFFFFFLSFWVRVLVVGLPLWLLSVLDSSLGRFHGSWSWSSTSDSSEEEMGFQFFSGSGSMVVVLVSLMVGLAAARLAADAGLAVDVGRRHRS